jgi:hypothetical protein
MYFVFWNVTPHFSENETDVALFTFEIYRDYIKFISVFFYEYYIVMTQIAVFLLYLQNFLKCTPDNLD